MPLATTLLGSTFNTSSGTKTVTATPAVGDLIVIIAAHTANTALTTPTDDNSSGTYTRVVGSTKNSFVDVLNIFVRDSLIGSASSTVFTHAPGSTTGGGIAVLKITGSAIAGSSAVRQSGNQNEGFSATPAPVLGAVLASSTMIGALFNGANPAGVTERSIYTELLDTGYATPTTGIEVMSLDTGETGTVISWGSSVSSSFCDVIIEIYGPTEIDPPLFVNANDFHTPDVISTTYPLTPSLFTNSNSFHAPTIAPDAKTISPPLFANTSTFYGPTVTGPGVLAPSPFVNANSFYGPTIGRGAVALHPPLFVNANQFVPPAIGNVHNIAPPLFANENTFYGPNLRGWIIESDDATVWTEVVNTSALTDENGDQILDESGDPITAEGDETWTAQTNDATIWTQAA